MTFTIPNLHNPEFFYECKICGCLVVDTDKHIKFHGIKVYSEAVYRGRLTQNSVEFVYYDGSNQHFHTITVEMEPEEINRLEQVKMHTICEHDGKFYYGLPE